MMLAIQLAPGPLNSFPRLPPLLIPSMSAPPPPQHPTSVFNALGSYADRIKSPNATTPGKPLPKVSPNPPAPKTASPKDDEPRNTADDGPWEKVQAGRQKSKQERVEERRGNGSKEWKDRNGHQDKHDDSEKRTLTKTGKKGASVSPATAEKPPISRPTATTPAGGTTRSAWGLSTPVTQSQSHSTPGSTTSTTIQTPSTNNPRQSQTVPSSPSLNGTTVAASVPDSIASPDLSADTASSSTAPTSVVGKGDDELEWRIGTKQEEAVSARKAAPPPAVNAWEVRKKQSAPVGNGDGQAVREKSAPLQFGSVLPALSAMPQATANKGIDEKVNRTEQKNVKAEMPPGPLNDETLWPDVATAEVINREEKKDQTKERKDNEDTVVDEPAGPSRKAKWKAIPATELQAAADEQAEVARRQAAARKRATGVDSGRGKPKKAGERGTRGEEIRLPPQPPRGTSVNGYKPVFGTIERESESGGSGAIVAEEVAITNGGLSAPLSRQTSRKSPRTSPTKPTSQLPNPDAQVFESSLRFGSGPYSSRPMTGSATAPIPQYPFSQNRPPRGRDARLAMVHPRGRGGYRNASVPAKGFTSQTPPQTSGEGQAYPRGQMASTYMPAYGQQGYDPVQAGYMQMQMIGRGPPPPPMPQTSVPSLDPLRFYVLGQVEYYFSMQNLAMDFFLRQQMDTEGWIDIPMVASFNRVKSLTPDLAIIKEVMSLSDLLEIREDKVRLARGESKRWVLPDAKPCPFGPDPSPSPTSPLQEDNLEPHPFAEEMQGPAMLRYAPGDVGKALMKSQPERGLVNGDEEVEVEADESMDKSTSVTDAGGDGGDETETPATSMSGDGKEEVEVR